MSAGLGKALEHFKEFGRRFAGIGGSSPQRRLGTAAAYLLGGGLTSKYIEHAADEKRAYYGQSRYDSYYGGAASALSGTASLAGMWYGGFALLGRDPISRGINSAKYLKARGGLARGRASNAAYEGSLGMAGKPYDVASGAAKLEKLGQYPKLGLRQLATYGVMAGMTVEGSNPAEIIAAGAGADFLLGPQKGLSKIGKMFAPSAAVTKTAAATGGSNMGRRLAGFGASMGAIAGGGYTGYKTGLANNNETAEGTITSFDRYNSSAVRRMNYSTAGLGLALHSNNRKF